MNAKLQQRIIGTVVLVALGVIFVPMFIGKSDHNDNEHMLTRQIPPVPDSQQIDNLAKRNHVVDNAATTEVQILEQSVGKQNNIKQNVANEPTATPINQNLNEITTVDSEANPKPIANQGQPTIKQANSAKITTNNLVTTTNNQAVVNKSKQTNSQHSAPTLAAPKAWAIQVASFSDATHAVALVKKLRAKGFTAYQQSAVIPQGDMHRVFVGPELNESKAKQMLAQIRTQFGINGIIVQFKPQST